MRTLVNTYIGNDGRVRAYVIEDGIPKIVSYPRILMEESLGRPLDPMEDVHHIDGNTLNNNLSNLELINHGDHQRMHNPGKYFDKIMVCQVCGKSFIWTAARQSLFYTDLRRGKTRYITCSRSCASFIGRQEQLGRNSLAECGLNGEPSPNGNTVPNT